MTINNCKIGLNMPQALASVGSGETEFVHQLPPYHRRKAFLVDEYPACPSDWLRSTGRVKSYFVPIIEGAGLWLDLNHCLKEVPQHVAVVVSVQGVNAATGLPCKDAQLEQYRDECPKHKKPFGPDRLCKECGYKWPKQNYLATAGTPEGQFWLDGFRAEDGKVRQYVLTAQKERGVAKAIVGDERVHALGLSFFLTKEKRPERPAPERMRSASVMSFHSLMDSPGVDSVLYDKSCSLGDSGPTGPLGPPGASLGDTTTNWGACAAAAAGPATYSLSVDNTPLLKAMAEAGVAPETPPTKDSTKISAKYSGSLMSRSASASVNKRTYDAARHLCSVSSDEPVAANFMEVASAAPVAMRSVAVKKMEIAAGARIDQQVYPDPLSLDAYQAEPEGIIVINYASEQDCDRIIAAGKVDLSGSKEGFLKNVPTGNPV